MVSKKLCAIDNRSIVLVGEGAKTLSVADSNPARIIVYIFLSGLRVYPFRVFLLWDGEDIKSSVLDVIVDTW